MLCPCCFIKWCLIDASTGVFGHCTVKPFAESCECLLNIWTQGRLMLPAGRLYVAGGMTSTRTRLASVEAYDPREGKWSLIAAMGVPRSSAEVAALADCLFAVGGNAGDDWIHNSVEMYIPAAGRWLQRASIAFARSGLAIAAL